ncbi:MAG: hypothetical protein R3F65_21480 [bacterium]
MAGSYADLSICGDDVDFYAIEICAGGTLTLDVLFTHAGGDIDVLFGDADDIITSSESGSDNERSSQRRAKRRPSTQIFGFRRKNNTPASDSPIFDGATASADHVRAGRRRRRRDRLDAGLHR